MATDVLQRLAQRVVPEPNSGCWLWDGLTTHNGYGRIGVNGRDQRAHRVSYELHCGPIPEGAVGCHRCDIPACVNPAHLFLGTVKDNVFDRSQKGRGKFGEQHGRAKLDDAQVRDIWRLLTAGRVLHAEIARRYGVSRGRISDIAAGKTWKHVRRE